MQFRINHSEIFISINVINLCKSPFIFYLLFEISTIQNIYIYMCMYIIYLKKLHFTIPHQKVIYHLPIYQ